MVNTCLSSSYYLSKSYDVLEQNLCTNAFPVRLADSSEDLFQLPEERPEIRKQVKAPQPSTTDEPGSIVGQPRKRTASNAELDAPTAKKPKVDEAGTILLDDDDDDDDVEIL